MFTERGNELCGCCGYFLQHSIDPGQLSSALCQSLTHLHTNNKNLVIKGFCRIQCVKYINDITCGPKLRAAGMPGASVPGMRRRIFLQNCRMSLQEVSRSLSSTQKLSSSCPACKKALRRPTSTAMQSRALWVNYTQTGVLICEYLYPCGFVSEV